MNLDYIYSDMVIWMSDISWNKLTEQQQSWLTQSLEETFKEASDTLWNITYEAVSYTHLSESPRWFLFPYLNIRVREM